MSEDQVLDEVAEEETLEDVFEEDAPESSDTEKEEKKLPKEIHQLAEDKINMDVGLTFETYQEMIGKYGGWNKMNNALKNAVNKMFRVPGVFGQGAAVVPHSKAEKKAIEIKSLVSKAMYAVLENFSKELTELSKLNTDKNIKPLSVQVYFSNWKPFYAGLPEDK